MGGCQNYGPFLAIGIQNNPKKHPQVPENFLLHMYYSLNSLKGGYLGDYVGATIGVIKGDTRSLDYGSYDISVL